jgi:carboxyl-terminal processing protease
LRTGQILSRFACATALLALAGCSLPRDLAPSPPSDSPARPANQTPGQEAAPLPASTSGPLRPAVAPARATPVAAAPSPTVDAQVSVFQKTWQLINSRYVYKDFNGADWASVYTPTLTQIRTGLDQRTFYELMYGVVDTLADGHTYFLSPDEARAEDETYAGAQEYLDFGFSYDVSDQMDYAYVLQVRRGGPAEKAGLRIHDHISRINGAAAVDNTIGDLADAFFDDKVLTATLTVQTPSGKPRPITLTKARIPDVVQIDAKILPGKKRIGYLAIPSFDEEGVAGSVRAALRDLAKAGALDGLVIDVRLNGGGSLEELAATMGLFSSGVFGKLVDRAGAGEALTATAENIGNSQKAPLVVLTGRRTASAGEILAGALQAKKRAKVVGQRTEGNVESIVAHDLPDGSVLWLAEKRLALPDGRSWEGDGLSPDKAVDAEWDSFTEETDPYLKAALEILGR